MTQQFPIRTIDDIRKLEAEGFDAFLPDKSPFALLERTASRLPDACAIRYLREAGETDRVETFSYRQLVGKIRQAANLFRKYGIDETSSVAILAPHVASTQIALWGAEVAGRVCPINPMLRPDHVASLLAAANCKVAVVLGCNPDMPAWETLVPALRQTGLLSHILHCDADADTPGSDGCFETLIEAERGERLDFEPDHDTDRIVAFFHTGGTTGAPKLAMHTALNQAFVGRSAAAMYAFTGSDVIVNGFPLFHVAGSFVYGLSALFAGASIVIPTRTGMRNRHFVSRIWQKVERYGVTVIGGVPTVISALNAVPLDADISSLRVMLTGGSPLPSELAAAFEERTGKPVRNILGMTECAGVVTIEPFHGRRTPRSTGLRLPFTRVAAFRASGPDASLDQPCTPGETGVIALKGPNVGPGYSEASRNAGTFDADGWLISGDLGHVDGEGRVYVTGRAKDVIIRGAHNIDPSMIEEALMRHPYVAMAAAVGQPDSYAGELPVAFVTLKEGAGVTAEELRSFVDPIVSEPAARPKSVQIIAEMPLTPIGKIFKPALRRIAVRQAMIESLGKAGVAAANVEVDVGENGALIRLTRASDVAPVREALTGMPVRYSIEATG